MKDEGSNEDTLHEVTLFTVGRGMREAAEASQNREWHIKLQPLNPDGAQSIDNQISFMLTMRSGQWDVAFYDNHVPEVHVVLNFSVFRGTC